MGMSLNWAKQRLPGFRQVTLLAAPCHEASSGLDDGDGGAGIWRVGPGTTRTTQSIACLTAARAPPDSRNVRSVGCTWFASRSPAPGCAEGGGAETQPPAGASWRSVRTSTVCQDCALTPSCASCHAARRIRREADSSPRRARADDDCSHDGCVREGLDVGGTATIDRGVKHGGSRFPS